jgi:cytosine/adenosine deaminase-related metal-dependent hydrolase
MPPATIIHDTTVVTVDDAGTVERQAALVAQQGRIAAVGPSAALLARYPDAERVDGRGRVVFPGFANTHTHLPRVLARGIYEDLSPPHAPPFTGGLSPLPLPHLTPEQERVMALLGALEAIRSGTTLVLEEGSGLDGYAGALVDTGLRLVSASARGTAPTRRSASRDRSTRIRGSGTSPSSAFARSTRGGMAPAMAGQPPGSPRGPRTCARPNCCAGCGSCRANWISSQACI